jgi:DNA topoisomerase-1
MPSSISLQSALATDDDDCLKAGLVYIDDQGPGIRREKVGDDFRYVAPDGSIIDDLQTLARIKALAIPPAYTQVWICPDPFGHIQATGRDARGRKQYRYHQQWHEVRDATKYQQLEEFARALPRIRRAVERDLKTRGLGRQKVLAVVVRLLEMTLIRVGTQKYARSNKSYGLTTLRRRHTRVIGDRVRFQFKGKSGVRHDVTVNDRRVARIVKRCMEIPGHELFTYLDDDGVKRVAGSADVNAYLKQVSGTDFTAKHYRTWAASVYAMAQLQARDAEWRLTADAALDRPLSSAALQRTVAEVVKETAQRLGNTPTVCRKCYIHPAVIEAWMAGDLPVRCTAPGPRGLNADERRLYAFLRSWHAAC